jgi:hypothetical protein
MKNKLLILQKESSYLLVGTCKRIIINIKKIRINACLNNNQLNYRYGKHWGNHKAKG